MLKTKPGENGEHSPENDQGEGNPISKDQVS